MRPICELCNRAVPEGVDGVFLDGLTICGPCLWDEYTPGWVNHQQHDEDYATCSQCRPVAVDAR